MPKEVIYDAGTPFHKTEVTWSSQRGLQSVGVTVATAILSDSTEQESPTIEGWNDFSCHLNRDGINRMIRALRKARDQQFGADA